MVNFAKDSRPRRKLVVDGIETMAIVDTGAEPTIFMSKTMNKTEAPQMVFGLPSGGRLFAKGPVKTSFKLEDRDFEHEVFLADTEEALIGADFLHKHGAVISMASHQSF